MMFYNAEDLKSTIYLLSRAFWKNNRKKGKRERAVKIKDGMNYDVGSRDLKFKTGTEDSENNSQKNYLVSS